MLKYKSVPGAYILTHVPSGHYYVGSTNNLLVRYKSHLATLSSGTHRNSRLQSLFTIPDEFEFTPIPTANPSEAREIEQTLLDERHGLELCCNVGTSAVGLWKNMPEYVKVAMNEGRKRSPVWLEAVRNAQRGQTYRLGMRHTDETKAKISAAKMGKSTGRAGIKATPETVAILVEAQRKLKDLPGYREMKLAAGAKRAVPVSVEGVTYPSKRHAAEVLGLDPACVDYRLRSKTSYLDWFLLPIPKP